jgi:hypothetical protein
LLGPSRVIDCFAGAPSGDVVTHLGNGNPSPLTSVNISSSRDEFSPRCKLVDYANINGNYAALSCCWGELDYKSYVTTEKNVASRRESIEETKLPQIFQDAIRVARNLNIRYLWIDALCIIQDWLTPPEARVDWIAESSKMGDIFGNALVTICAASAVGSEGGLFNEKSQTEFDHPDRTSCTSTSVRFLNSNGETNTIHFVGDGYGVWDCRKSDMDSCLDRRVWCYQEELLSPRKIYYCKDQLYWHCDHATVSEDRLVDGAAAPRGVAAFLTSSDSRVREITEQLSRYWYKELISEGYSKRETTYEGDRLAAVSGLARKVRAATKSRYLAGLWESNLVYGLNWEAEESSRTRTKTDGVPSWSWASQQGGICYWDPANNPACTLIRADINYLNPDDLFGDVTYGALTLRGKLFSLTPKGDGHKIPHQQNVSLKLVLDDHRFDPADKWIMALLLDTDTCWERITLLFVTTSASDPSKYTRIGRGSFNGGPWKGSEFTGVWDVSEQKSHIEPISLDGGPPNEGFRHLLGILESLPESEIVLM